MVDAREHRRRGRSEFPGPGIDEHPVLARVDEQAGVRGGDAVGGEIVLPQHLLDVLPGDVGEEGLERIVEGAVADGDDTGIRPTVKR